MSGVRRTAGGMRRPARRPLDNPGRSGKPVRDSGGHLIGGRGQHRPGRGRRHQMRRAERRTNRSSDPLPPLAINSGSTTTADMLSSRPLAPMTVLFMETVPDRDGKAAGGRDSAVARLTPARDCRAGCGCRLNRDRAAISSHAGDGTRGAIRASAATPRRLPASPTPVPPTAYGPAGLLTESGSST